MVVPRPPLPETSEVVRVTRINKARLLAREATQSQFMVSEWLKIERSLSGRIVALVDEIAVLSEAGAPITRGKIVQLDRFIDLMQQTRTESARYAGFTTDLVSTGQLELGQLAIADASQIIEVSFNQAGKIGPAFNRLNVGAVEAIAGIAGDGQPISKLVNSRVIAGADEATAVINTLIESTALGINPARTATLIKDDLSAGLNKALQIARTEQLRAYRESTRQQYIESGVVKGYMRISARDVRVCPACIMADGNILLLETSFEEHVQGRCTLVPNVIGAPDPTWQTGKQWFMTQPPEVQKQIIGPGRFDAWQGGQFKLDDLITKRTNRTWGNALVPTPLKDLVQ